MIGKNNPFNIRVSNSRWIGSDGETRGFVNFCSLEYGVRAAAILVMRTYRMKSVCTISEIINRFAPPSENNTQRYIDFVCGQMSCFPFDIPKRNEFSALLCAMSVYEGNPVSITDINEVLYEFNIKPYKCRY